ncbi:hypothetical protein K439DRAFT_1624100 [Ramaria rubella]|nr:hypothetical protein K439DRAFT_1624100 [Ramaria rubella]
MPLITQSDPGSENYGVVNGHTTGRHMVDPSLEGTRQHRWMHGHNNVKPEITWSQLHCRFTPGVKYLLDDGLNKGWYDPSDPLDMLLFHWLFIPWLQGELDTWKDSHNMTPKHADKNKILPHGRPQLICEAPTMFNSLDFKVPLPQAAIENIQNQYAPADDPVFHLVLTAFDNLAHCIYNNIGHPTIVCDTIWGIYAQMLVQVHDVYATDPTPALRAACEPSSLNDGLDQD